MTATTRIDTLQHFPLDVGHLCLDCRSVGNSGSWCPACASTHLLPLAKVLDRLHEPQDAIV